MSIQSKSKLTSHNKSPHVYRWIEMTWGNCCMICMIWVSPTDVIESSSRTSAWEGEEVFWKGVGKSATQDFRSFFDSIKSVVTVLPPFLLNSASSTFLKILLCKNPEKTSDFFWPVPSSSPTVVDSSVLVPHSTPLHSFLGPLLDPLLCLGGACCVRGFPNTFPLSSQHNQVCLGHNRPSSSKIRAQKGCSMSLLTHSPTPPRGRLHGFVSESAESKQTKRKKVCVAGEVMPRLRSRRLWACEHQEVESCSNPLRFSNL